MPTPQLLRTITFAGAGSFDEPLDSVRSRSNRDINYLSAIMLRIQVTLTSAATSDAITQEAYAAILPELQFFDQNDQEYFDRRLSLATLQEIIRYLLLAGPQQPAAIAADSNTTNTFTMLCTIPYYLPHMHDPWAALQPSALLKRVVGRWPVAGVWGTGQVVTTATTMEVYAIHRARGVLETGPRLHYGAFVPTVFVQGRVPLNGKIVTLGVGDPAAGATTTIGATDFTQYEIEGVNHNTRREDVDVPSLYYNSAQAQSGDADDNQVALATSGSARSFPLIQPDARAKISDLPMEREPAVTLIVGAGAPGLTDQEYIYSVLRPYSNANFARAIGNSRDFAIDARGVGAAITAATGPVGRKGIIPATSQQAPFLKRRLNLAITAQGPVRATR